MSSLYLYVKKRPQILILGFIILIGIFFRTYKSIDRFEFSHDADLYSWIVKDILVNHHIRLIGQLTSAPGIFIGGLFYYLLIPFFLITNMDPIGGIYLATTIGLLSILSYYFVFSKLFNIKIGLLTTFLYSVLLSPVNFDRWLVPTITTNLWSVWYFYTLIKVSRGEYSVLPLLGILIGLIWHIHIALIPTLIALPFSIFFSRKLPTRKDILKFLFSFFITSVPLFLFEFKHNFQQTHAIISNFVNPRDGASGLYKFILVLNMITKNINSLLFSPLSFKLTNNIFFVLLFLLLSSVLVKKKLVSLKELTVLLVWIISVVLFFSFTSSPISEYYFSNFEIIFIYISSLYLHLLFKSGNLGKILTLSILVLILGKNLNFIINQDYYHKGYIEKKSVVEFIDKDAKNKGYPCIGISYITAIGENVGFRYLFYLKNTHLVHPSINIPVYNIVIPSELSAKEATQRFGHIGLILPKDLPSKEAIQISCRTPNTNLTDSMFGYVE